MTNEEFLKTIKKSFKAYIDAGTSRSTAKLKSLHGDIAQDVQNILGSEFIIKSQGFNDGKEASIQGRYYAKDVDITVESRDGKALAGYAVKFIVRNYSQNNINYFENMLGETANIRCNKIPYFQIFIIFDKVPYFGVNGAIKKMEAISEHNLEKYIKLSKDNVDIFQHIPDRTLFILLSLKDENNNFKNIDEYRNYYNENIEMDDLITYSSLFNNHLDGSVIYNNYNDFIRKTTHLIIGKM